MITNHAVFDVSSEPRGYRFRVEYTRSESLSSVVHTINLRAEDLGHVDTKIILLGENTEGTITECDLSRFVGTTGTVEDLIAVVYGPDGTEEDKDQVAQLTKNAMMLVNLVDGVLLTFIKSVKGVTV